MHIQDILLYNQESQIRIKQNSLNISRFKYSFGEIIDLFKNSFILQMVISKSNGYQGYFIVMRWFCNQTISCSYSLYNLDIIYYQSSISGYWVAASALSAIYSLFCLQKYCELQCLQACRYLSYCTVSSTCEEVQQEVSCDIILQQSLASQPSIGQLHRQALRW